MFTVEIPLSDPEAALERAEAWARTHNARATELVGEPLALWVLLDGAPGPEALAGLETPAVVRPAELLDDGSTWSASLRPIRIGGAEPGSEPLWIVPEPHATPAGATYAVRLESRSAAFGSGLHPTTQLCLERIIARSPVSSVLDIGAGSGVLALAALTLGAERALATELDPAARAIAAANADRNGQALEIRGADALYELDERFDLVLANILGPELIALAPAITRTLASGATLLLSGIRPGLRDEVSRRYVNLGLALIGSEERDGWWVLELVARW